MRQRFTLREIAPPIQAPNSLLGKDVWLLNLDQIEPHTGKLLSRTSVESSAVGASTHAFDAGNLLYSKLRPYLNKVYLPDGVGFCTSELVPLRPNPNLVTREYLAAYLRSPKFLAWVDQQVDGAKMPRVSMKIFWDYEIDLPSLDEQKRIIAIVQMADRLRRKRQEVIRLADDFMRAVFVEMFGDPVSNTKHLPTEVIERLCPVATGATPSRERTDYFGGAHPWVKTGEVDSPWITKAEEHISDLAIKETNCKIFPARTVLIAMYGQGKTRGKAGMLGMPAATNQACAAILPSTSIDPFFLHAQLSLMYDHLRAMGRGGNQENLNLGMIKSLPVLVPPPVLVKSFLAIRQRTELLIEKARLAESESARLARSLGSTFLA